LKKKQTKKKGKLEKKNKSFWKKKGKFGKKKLKKKRNALWITIVIHNVLGMGEQ